jgi:acetyltransferase-like isoleucine patch superfamily enzyme
MEWARLPWRLRYDVGARALSEARRLAILATHTHTRVEIPRPVRLGPGFDLVIPGTGEFVVGRGCDFRRGFVAEIASGGRVEIGPGCTFTSHALVQCSTSIVIGSRVVFGQNLMLADGNHRFRDHTRHLLDQGYEFNPIRIGDNAIVTSKCTILADIGEGAVIGSNSVVTKPIPPFCLAAGAPAKVVEYFGPSGEPETSDVASPTGSE